MYNGNITNATMAINQLGNPVGYTYHYDQLNRLKKMRQYTGISGTSWSRSNITLNYQENATYDGNGNILTYGRNGAAPTAQTIDSLTYNYSRNTAARLNSNKLQSINDAIATSNYTLDLRNQTNATNYRYDAIGNLIYDAQSNITGNDGVNAITWSVYGKIQSIYKTAGTISYTYNPAGQRVSKTAGGITTWYIRDAQGNTLAVYNNAHSNVNWREQDLYGSSRLGMWLPNVNLAGNNAQYVADTVGKKVYELDNHLANVLTTVSDKRLQHSTNGTSIDYFTADVAAAQDYYPFGMLMPGRQYTFGSDSSYRYGFNGKENDNEVKGMGNEQNYGQRIYDPRVGKFLSVDPLTGTYPWYTPYQFAGNSPIAFIDLDGKEEVQPSISYDPISQTGSASYPALSKSQWKMSDRGSASGTFATAAAYNTHTLNNSVYEPVNQIHQYYVWAGREIDKTKANIKFFQAAADVTGLSSVGAAYGNPFVNDRVQESLAGVNKKLLEINIGTVNEILTTGRSNAVGGTGSGVDFDIRYVLHEQRTLTAYLNEHPLSDYDKGVINRLLNFGSFLRQPQLRLAAELTGASSLDYGIEKQRFAIGHSLTFLKHLESGDFKNNSKGLNQYYRFFESFYGKENTQKFKDDINKNYSDKLK